MSAAFALDFSGPPVPCDYPGCVLDAYHDGDHKIGIEVVEQHFREAGVPTKRNKDGDLFVQCTDATFEYLAGDRASYLAPLMCRCSQRDYPHDLSVHTKLRSEKPGTYFVWDGRQESLVEFADTAMRWPWSLKLSRREEPSTERNAA